jgi:hypothetical protein
MQRALACLSFSPAWNGSFSSVSHQTIGLLKCFCILQSTLIRRQEPPSTDHSTPLFSGCKIESQMPSALLPPGWFGFLSRPAGKAVYFFFIAIYYMGAGKRRLTWPWDDSFSFKRNLPFLAGARK